MAEVRKRQTRAKNGRGKTTYQVRFYDPDGIQRSRTFKRSSDAEAFKITVEADKIHGRYVDLVRSRVLFADFADEWLDGQSFAESTRETTGHKLNKHILPTFGSTPLYKIKSSNVQSWIKSKSDLSPRYVRGLHQVLSQILTAAVDDDRLPKNVARASSITLPKIIKKLVVPWTDSQVLGLYDALPDRFRIALVLAAGLGLRQGEVFGLAVDDIDFQHGIVHVQRQVKIVNYKMAFDLPKGRKERDVPLSEGVALELAAYLKQWPVKAVSLPWEHGKGAPATAQLVMSSRESKAMNRNYFNEDIWRPARIAVGLPDTRDNGLHAGRHFYASDQLQNGTNIRALASYLGHDDPSFTLRTYTHLMPASDENARRATGTLFRRLTSADVRSIGGPNVAHGPA